MAINEDRMQILHMLQEGTITAQEAEELLSALGQDEPFGTDPVSASSGGKPQWLRIRVTDKKTGSKKVNVNIPYGLVDVALRVGTRFVPETEDIDIDAIMRQVRDGGLRGKIVDVEDEEDGEHVEIFVE